MKRLVLISGIVLAALPLTWLTRPVATNASPVHQATDILRRTPTTTATAQATPATLGWRGQIVSNIPNATSGSGSIVRVRVFERENEPITLTYYDIILSGLSGTKPEHGPYAAEFAPVPAGRWTLSLPNLGASIEIEADGSNMVVVEFSPFTAAEATVAAQTSPTPTPIGGEPWEGRLIEVRDGPLLDGAILRVTVQGQSAHTIRISTPIEFVAQGVTGTKEELASDTAEFAPLATGRYIVTPAGLNASITIDLKRYSTALVEFRPVSAWPRPTATPTPPSGTSTATPSATPTPSLEWIGSVLRHERSHKGEVFSTIAVRVNGLQDLPVRLMSGDTTLTCTTGDKPEHGNYACEFGALSPGTYTINAQGLEPVVPVMIGQGDFVLVEFRSEPMPSSPMVWLGRVVRNDSQPWPGNGLFSAIAIRVDGRRGQVVSLRAAGDWEAFCNTGTKPEYGENTCEFGGLWPGVYTLSPVGIPAQVSLYMDGVGFAEVAFESFVATATPAPSPTRVIGAGASRASTPVIASNATSKPPTRAGTPTPALPRPAATATPTLTPTPTPTPPSGWVGRVAQDDAGVGIGTIVVRVLGLKNQPVILHSGPWSIRGFTGSKLEYGENAVEFGGLNQGDFTVELEGMGTTLPVHLRPGGFLLVEFRYDLLPTPTPTPQRGTWVGAVTRNTSGNAPAGAWSTIIVKVAGKDGQTVTFNSPGFVTTCVTGTKPEHGVGACEVGGLWPGTYRVIPEGLGPSVDVQVDGQGSATVEFWIQ